MTGNAPRPIRIADPTGIMTNLSRTTVIAMQSPMTASVLGEKRVVLMFVFIKASFPVLPQKGGAKKRRKITRNKSRAPSAAVYLRDCTTAGCERKTASPSATSSADNSLFRRHFKCSENTNALRSTLLKNIFFMGILKTFES